MWQISIDSGFETAKGYQGDPGNQCVTDTGNLETTSATQRWPAYLLDTGFSPYPGVFLVMKFRAVRIQF